MEKAHIEIMVVGTGGTGGAYLTGLARYLYSLPEEYKGSFAPCVTIIDGDRVEKRNVCRQPFQLEDIGEYKSVIMSEVIREVYGLPHISSMAKFISKASDISQSWYHKNNKMTYGWSEDKILYILVGCVDNHHARKIMHEYFESKDASSKNILYLDAANEYSVGEVVIAARSGMAELAPPRKFYYPDIFNGQLKSAEELSCLEVNEIAPQHLVTNQMAANILLVQTVTAIDNMIHEGTVSGKGGIVYFDAFKNASRFEEYRKDKDYGTYQK